MARRPRAETMQENRQRLMAAARKAFAEKGYAAASMDELTALSGWRAEVFGRDALRLASGEIALSAQGGAVRVVPVTV